MCVCVCVFLSLYLCPSLLSSTSKCLCLSLSSLLTFSLYLSPAAPSTLTCKHTSVISLGISTPHAHLRRLTHSVSLRPWGKKQIHNQNQHSEQNKMYINCALDHEKYTRERSGCNIANTTGQFRSISCKCKCKTFIVSADLSIKRDSLTESPAHLLEVVVRSSSHADY